MLGKKNRFHESNVIPGMISKPESPLLSGVDLCAVFEHIRISVGVLTVNF